MIKTQEGNVFQIENQPPERLSLVQTQSFWGRCSPDTGELGHRQGLGAQHHRPRVGAWISLAVVGPGRGLESCVFHWVDTYFNGNHFSDRNIT